MTYTNTSALTADDLGFIDYMADVVIDSGICSYWTSGLEGDHAFVEKAIDKATRDNPPVFIESRDGQHLGLVVKERGRLCPMEGCTGVRMCVVRENGKATYPCSKGVINKGENLLKLM